MANTNALYNAAYTGALSGISSRWLSSEAVSTYPTAKAACVAYATAVDDILGVIVEPSQADVNLLQQISSSFWEDRMPLATDASDYTAEVTPLCDLFMAARDELIPGGVGVIGTDNVINESSDNGVTATDALESLSGEFPPAICLSMFGTTAFNVMMADQITASNNQEPGLIWTPPFAVNRYAIGPGNRIYSNASTGGQSIRKHQYRLSSGSINRYTVGDVPVAASGMPAFFSQAPRSTINPSTLYVGSTTGASRIGGVLNDPTSAWSAIESLTFGPPSNGSDLAFDVAGNMWIAATGLSRINAAAAPGAVAVDVRFTGANWPASSAGVIVAPNGDVWYSNYAVGGGTLRKVTAAQVTASIGAGPLDIVPNIIITSPNFVGLQNIVMDYAGNIWGSCFDTPSIVMIAAGDLGSSGAKAASIVLTGGGQFGNGTTIGPATIRFFETFGPLR